ncbi:MAG TPA: hypothetical protein VEK07_20040 [Polyangiaceae bacterium]|nr:hypothetical protein [Polyangiaceae bacterium]
MAGIPPTIETDSEDVAWALQTADALWKRDERLDAIVWLRRAAQAAGDAEDDDRALVLARNAAELADWMGRISAPSSQALPHALPQRDSAGLRAAGGGVAARSPVPPAHVNAAGVSLAEPSGETPPAHPEVGTAPRSDEVDRREEEATSPDITLPVPTPTLSTPRPKWPVVTAPLAMPSVVPTLKPGRVTALPPAPPLPGHRALSEEAPSSPVDSAHVPTAAEVHAGMLDPWAEAEPSARVRDLSDEPASRSGDRPSRPRELDDVVTSAPPVSQRGASQRATPAPSAASPVRTGHAAPRQASAATPPPSAPPPSRPGSGTLSQTAPEPPPPSAGSARIDELGIPLDWPESTRRALSRAASVRELASDEEASGFALVSILQGAADVAATIVDAPAERLHTGTMLRARGTIDATVPLRVIAATGGCRVATWNEKQVVQALAPCPEVEEALRGAGNRIQALVGATMGPLGERLDTALREEVTSRLRVRIVAEHELVAKAGQPVPGLLVIGSGELEPLGKAGAPEGPVLRSGDFLFPTEVLRAASAPRSVRGAKGGALVLMADRVVAQELLVTFPLLLEIFAEA